MDGIQHMDKALPPHSRSPLSGACTMSWNNAIGARDILLSYVHLAHSIQPLCVSLSSLPRIILFYQYDEHRGTHPES